MSFVPPSNVAKIAAAALEMRAEFNRGGTMVGVARATQLKNREELSLKTIKRMVSFFARHEVDKKGQGFYSGDEGYPSAGRIAWDLWGGDAGKTWAEKELRSAERKEEGATAMTDVKVLSGAAVRRIDGKQGRIKAVSLPWVTVEWSNGKCESFLRSDEALSEDIEIKTLNDGWVAIGNLVGLAETAEAEVETDEDVPTLIASLRGLGEELVSEAKKIVKAKDKAKAKAAEKRKGRAVKKAGKKKSGGKKGGGHTKGGGNPYTNISNRGPSPEDVPKHGGKTDNFFGIEGQTEMPQSDNWSCKNVGKYKAKCTGPNGEVKIIKINKAYKKKYNKAYRKAEKAGETNSVRGKANR